MRRDHLHTSLPVLDQAGQNRRHYRQSSAGPVLRQNGFAHAGAPFFAEAKLPSMKASSRVESTPAAQVFSQSFQHTAHDTGANPLLETAVAGLVGGIPLGQIGPR